MNYLAHAYLSFNDTAVLLGNMSSDFIKGKQKLSYSSAIQAGIMLHRSIDIFTDNHNATKQAKQYFKEAVGLYAGAFVDVVYDHFLANDTNAFANEANLKSFAQQTYQHLQANKLQLPIRLQQMLPYMQEQDWLYNYRQIWGIEKSFEGVTRRAAYLTNFQKPFAAFQEHYKVLGSCYQAFFPDVKKYALQQFQLLKIA